jgi:hypothetical protein
MQREIGFRGLHITDDPVRQPVGDSRLMGAVHALQRLSRTPEVHYSNSESHNDLDLPEVDHLSDRHWTVGESINVYVDSASTGCP